MTAPALQHPAPQAKAPAQGPVSTAERIVPLDVLRGFALLGILVMNVQFFAMPGAAYENPTAYGDLTGANYAVWYLGALLADLKFMAVFSMLFGAGIVLMAGRQQAAGRGAAWLHVRRMAVLLAFGLFHAYVLWPGDILFTYAVCGLAIYPLRRLPAGLLLLLGLLVLAVGSGISLGTYESLSSWPPDRRQELAQDFQPTPEMIAEEIATHQGGWAEEFQARWPVALYVETEMFVGFLAWRAGGLMLLGMALFKLGVLSGARPAWLYTLLVAVALLVGLPITAYGISRNFASGWDAGYAHFAGSQYNYWASVLVALGWVGLVMRACRRVRLRPLTRPLAAVGQTALSNYLAQTLVCTTLFYGYGLGLFGRVERVGQAAAVCGVWALQLTASTVWLRYFRFGPAEWLWRSLTYGRLQPMRWV